MSAPPSVVAYSFADGSTDPWVKAQLKAFSGWINSSLNENVVRESSFALDLSNGVVLLRLLQALETKSQGKGQEIINSVRFHRVPRNRYHYIENFQIILKFLASQGTQLVNQDPHALSDESRNLKNILGLIWKIIQKYQLAGSVGLVKPSSSGDSKSAFSSCPPSSGGAPAGGAGYESDQDSYKMSPMMRKASVGFTSANDVMLFWLNNILMSNPEAVGVRVKDFGNSMADGIVFVHLVNALKPGALDTIMLRTREPKEVLHTAFSAAETIMGIPQLLDPDMLASGTRDPQSIMTYVSLFRNYESSMAKASSSSSLSEDVEAKAAAAAAQLAASEKLLAQQAEEQRKAEAAAAAANAERLRKEQEAQEAELAKALESARISAEADEKRRQDELDEEKELAEIESSRQAAQAAEALRIAKEKQTEADRAALKHLEAERMRLQQEEEERAKYVRPANLSPSQLVDYDANVSTFSVPARMSIYIENVSNNVASVARKDILISYAASGGISGSLSWTERDRSGKPFGDALSLPLHWITDIVRGNSAHVFRSLIAVNAQPANCLTIIAEEITPDNEKEISRVYLEAENSVDITTMLRRLQVILGAHDRILTIPDLNAPTGTFSVTQAPTLNDSKSAAAKESAAQDEVVKILKKGMVFSRYRVNEANVPVKETAFVFYHEEEGIGSGGICWCEVGQKNVDPDNYLPLKLISAIYCGKKQPMLKAPIADAAQDDRCLSIICKKKTVGINEIHLEASTKANLQLWLKGLTTLLSRGGKTVKEEIQKSLEKMYKGRPFICYEDKGSNIIIPRGVFVFYTAPSATAVLKGELGSINWCPQGQRVSVQGCSIQLDHITDIFLGKTGRVLCNEVAAKAAPDCCCSIVARHKSLHLQAESKDMMLSWIAGINHLLAASGKRIKQETNSTANPNTVANVDDVLGSSVYLAAADGDFATLQNALKNSTNHNQRDLDFAMFKCTVDLQARKVCLLLGAGANPNAKDAGQTPLHRALMFAALADVTALEMIIRLLVSKGADVEAKDEEGKTASSYVDGLDGSKGTVIKSAFSEKRTFEQMTAAVMMERRPSFSKRMSLSANP